MEAEFGTPAVGLRHEHLRLPGRRPAASPATEPATARRTSAALDPVTAAPARVADTAVLATIATSSGRRLRGVRRRPRRPSRGRGPHRPAARRARGAAAQRGAAARRGLRLARAQPIEFPTDGGLTAHAFYYPPANRDFVGPDRRAAAADRRQPRRPDRPATGAARRSASSTGPAAASRVVDVNYGGSTGYGRAYRERLRGQWGIVDVDDCVNAARYLVDARRGRRRARWRSAAAAPAATPRCAR